MMRSEAGTLASARSSAWAERVAPLVAILVAFAVPLLIVPPTLGVPLIDDWNYQLSVRHLVDDGRLWVAPWTAATLLLQIVWGALFAWPFGVGPVALRCSTLVASFGGTLACYGLFRELGAARGRATAGAIAVWLNPIMFGLSYTFMTDVPYLTLLSVTLFLLVRGINRGDDRSVAAASGVAGLSLLIRQQAMLIPVALVVWLLWARPIRPGGSLRRLIAAAVLPFGAGLALFAGWLATNGTTATQDVYLPALRAAGVGGLATLVWQMVVVACFFVGLFVFPVMVGASPSLREGWSRAGAIPRLAVILGLAVLVTWEQRFWERWHQTFPFIPWGSMIHEQGLGVLDAAGERPYVLPPWVWAALGVVFALAAVGALLLIVTRRRPPDAAGWIRSPAGLLAVVGAGQLATVVLPSLLIREHITFDRYLLPLLPCAIGTVLWALRDRRFALGPVVVVLCLLATIDLLGVQDWVAFKRAQWDTAAWLVNDQGIPDREVDAGQQWLGLRFYETSLAYPEDKVARRPGDIWWLYELAPMVDPVYIVAASPYPRRGYRLAAERPYHSWIRPEGESRVYVWRREG